MLVSHHSAEHGRYGPRLHCISKTAISNSKWVATGLQGMMYGLTCTCVIKLSQNTLHSGLGHRGQVLILAAPFLRSHSSQ